MPRKTRGYKPSPKPIYVPEVSVSPWRDPATGEIFFRVNGPMQVSDARASLLKRSDLATLVEQASLLLEATDSEAA